MKYLCSLGIIILLFTACANTEYKLPNKANYSEKEYIKKANTGELEAIINLNQFYKYPQTAQGLKHFNKWYKIVEKSDDSENILKIANIYLEYKDMFINGEKKALNLYKKSYALGNLDAATTLIGYYILTANLDAAKKIEKDVIDKLSKENLIQLYKAYYEAQNRKEVLKILSILKKKGFKQPFSIKLSELEYALKTGYKKRREEKKKALIKEAVESKNIENMLQLAKLLYKKKVFQDSIEMYKEIFKLDNTNAQAYYDITLAYKDYGYRKRKKEKMQELALPYLIKASVLNHKEASKDLLRYYSSNAKFLDKYFALKQRLLKSDQGKMVLASHYAKSKYYLKAFELYDIEASKGNKKAIIYLASLRPDRYSFEPEKHTLSKKWKNYILNSEDLKLKKEYMKELYRYSHKKDVKEFNAKLIEQIDKKSDTFTNIMKLRDIALYYKHKYPKKAEKYYKKAADFGDVFSKRKLSGLYLGNKLRNYAKSISILEELMNQGDYDAGMQLAQFYRYGSNQIKKDMEKVIKIYEFYAQKGDITCMDSLVRIYVCNSCNQSKYLNYDRGFYYTQKLVELRGSKYDYATLGWLYNTGKGVKLIDLEKAKKYYEKSAELGYYDMYYYLAWLYYQDKRQPIIKLDYKQAKYYLDLAVKHHVKNAYYLLGVFYEKGLGVEKDINKAKEFYKKSYTKEGTEALKQLEEK